MAGINNNNTEPPKALNKAHKNKAQATGMSPKQQMLISLMCKYCRQFFLYRDIPSKELHKIRVRNDIHCVDEMPHPEWERDVRVQRRMADMGHGVMVPQNQPYDPVAGWPVTAIDDLVMNVMAQQLDERCWPTIKNHLAVREVKRNPRTTIVDPLRDQRDIHSYACAGYSKIKVHLAETAKRMHKTQAGYSFVKHFTETYEARMRQNVPVEDDGPKILSDDADVLLAKERVRRDEVRFLVTLKDMFEKLLLLRTRHLKSVTPIQLEILGTPEDMVKETKEEKIAGRSVNFKELILMHSPLWYIEHIGARTASNSFGSRVPRHKGDKLDRQAPATPTAPTAGPGRRESAVVSAAQSSAVAAARRKTLDDITKYLHVHWPPLWQSLAATEQGYQVPDAVANSSKEPPRVLRLKRKKSYTDIRHQRKEWANCRKEIAKNVDELLFRVDKEKLQTFYVKYGTLRDLSGPRLYDTHKKIMEQETLKYRCERQKHDLFDCELPAWYKALGDKTREVVERKDKEIDEILSKFHDYFNVGPTYPKFAKAKLALIVMSLPATTVCHLHVQRAIQFIMLHNFQLPPDTLSQWLAVRGLPFVLLPVGFLGFGHRPSMH